MEFWLSATGLPALVVSVGRFARANLRDVFVVLDVGMPSLAEGGALQIALSQRSGLIVLPSNSDKSSL
jgi:hypothetical protein